VKGTGIVYVRSRAKTEELAAFLSANGIEYIFEVEMTEKNTATLCFTAPDSLRGYIFKVSPTGTTLSYGDMTIDFSNNGEKTNIVGANVRTFRKKRRMSQQALSNKLELLGVYVCRGSVSRIEDGSRTVTDIELLAIAKILGVSINDLFINSEKYFE
jgi:DNA-binding XRE family transcriptional regulator